MNELLANINIALKSLEEFCSTNRSSINNWEIGALKSVLNLYKEKLTRKEEIDNRMLRAMKDIYVVTFRNFEGTKVYTSIENIDDNLRTLYEKYEKLEL